MVLVIDINNPCAVINPTLLNCAWRFRVGANDILIEEFLNCSSYVLSETNEAVPPVAGVWQFCLDIMNNLQLLKGTTVITTFMINPPLGMGETFLRWEIDGCYNERLIYRYVVQTMLGEVTRVVETVVPNVPLSAVITDICFGKSYALKSAETYLKALCCFRSHYENIRVILLKKKCQSKIENIFRTKSIVDIECLLELLHALETGIRGDLNSGALLISAAVKLLGNDFCRFLFSAEGLYVADINGDQLRIPGEICCVNSFGITAFSDCRCKEYPLYLSPCCRGSTTPP